MYRMEPKNKTKKEEKLKQKQICLEETVRSTVLGVSPDEESTAGGFVKQIGFKPSERVRELWMRIEESGELTEEVAGA